MAFHLLPLSQKSMDVVKEKISVACTQWINDWLPEGYAFDRKNVEMQKVDQDSLNEWLYLAKQNWFELSQNSRVGVAYSAEFSECLVAELTGCEYSELSNGVVDVKGLLEKIRLDLLNQIFGAELSCIEESSEYLEQQVNVASSMPNAAGWIVKLTIRQQPIMLLIPNEWIKKVVLQQGPQNSVELVNRESAIGDYRLKLKFKMDGLNISLQDLNTLQVGDVLTTRQKSTEQIKISVENSPLTEASVVLGKHKERKAVQFN